MTSVVFLGTSAAAPSLHRGFTNIAIMDEVITLMDCGDGAVRNVLKFGIDVREISSILLTHYHSDHISGLTQIIETMSIKKKQGALCVYGPPGLREYFASVQKTTNVAAHRNFNIKLNELNPGEKLAINSMNISTLKMDHTIPCLSYRIEAKGKIISFTGDTQPCVELQALGRNADLFIHEATFLQKDVELARPPKHSTPLEAATAAELARASRLILTHVNDDMEKPDEMLKEAQERFEKVDVAYDGFKIEL